MPEDKVSEILKAKRSANPKLTVKEAMEALRAARKQFGDDPSLVHVDDPKVFTEQNIQEVLDDIARSETRPEGAPKASPAPPPPIKLPGLDMAGADVARGNTYNRLLRNPGELLKSPAVRWAGELAANASALHPAIGPASQGARMAITAIPMLHSLLKAYRGGQPNDLSTSAASIATSAVAPKALAALGKIPGVPSAIPGMAVGAVQASLPTAVTDEGLRPPDLASAGLGGILGGAGAFLRSRFANAVPHTGTRTIENTAEAMGEVGPPGHLDSPRINLEGALADTARTANPVLASLAPKAAKNQYMTPGFTKPGVLKVNAAGGDVQKAVTETLDRVFSETKDKVAGFSRDQAASEMADLGKNIVAATGNPKAGMRSVLGYFFDKFYAAPGTHVETGKAITWLGSGAGNNRLQTMFEGMGLPPDKAADAVMSLKKFAQGFDKINEADAISRGPTGVSVSSSNLGGIRVSLGQGLVFMLKPEHAAESILRGNSAFAQAPEIALRAAKIARELEKNPNAHSGGTTALVAAFSNLMRNAGFTRVERQAQPEQK